MSTRTHQRAYGTHQSARYVKTARYIPKDENSIIYDTASERTVPRFALLKTGAYNNCNAERDPLHVRERTPRKDEQSCGKGDARNHRHVQPSLGSLSGMVFSVIHAI